MSREWTFFFCIMGMEIAALLCLLVGIVLWQLGV